MKKKIMVAITAAIMAMGSSCFASMGTQLDQNDQTSHTLVTALTQENADTGYASIVGSFNDSLKKGNTAEEFKKQHQAIADRLGKLEKLEFVQYQKAMNKEQQEVAILTYAGIFSKEKMVAIVIVYDVSGKMVEFSLRPLVQDQTTQVKK